MSERSLNSLSAHFEEHSGVMQSNSIKPRRMVVPQRGASKSSASSVAPLIDTKKSREVASMSEGNAAKDSTVQPNNMPTVVKETHEDACITPFSSSGASTQTFDEHLNPFDGQIDQIKPGGKDNNQMRPVNFESQQIDGKKKVQFSTGSIATPLGNISLLLLNLLGFIAVLWCFLGSSLCDIAHFYELLLMLCTEYYFEVLSMPRKCFPSLLTCRGR